MHTVCTFVLRLFVDSEAPDLLRGSLQHVPEEQPISFTDGQSLLWLLQRMSAHADGSCPDPDQEAVQQSFDPSTSAHKNSLTNPG
jgi:hypothetical protein